MSAWCDYEDSEPCPGAMLQDLSSAYQAGTDYHLTPGEVFSCYLLIARLRELEVACAARDWARVVALTPPAGGAA